MDQSSLSDSTAGDVDMLYVSAAESSDHSTTENPRPKHSRLLRLPAELRIQICRLIVIADTQIQVNSTYLPPPLLHVNRQVRHEAGGIYYLENNFRVLCPNFNNRYILQFGNDMITIPNIWKPSRFSKVSLVVDGQGLDRKNIVRWIEQWYDNAAPGIWRISGVLGRMAIARAFQVLEPLKGSVPWETAQKVVDEYLIAAKEQADGAWDWS